MKRKSDFLINDMVESIDKIQDYVGEINFQEFSSSSMKIDAVVRNLEIIGEAASQIDDKFKKKHKEIPWQKMKDFRNVITHKYWSVDKEIVWDILQNKLDKLKEQLHRIIK